MGIHFATKFIESAAFTNRAARIITGNFDYINVRGIDIVKRLQWMSLIERRDYVVALTVFKCIRGMAPTYISD